MRLALLALVPSLAAAQSPAISDPVELRGAETSILIQGAGDARPALGEVRGPARLDLEIAKVESADKPFIKLVLAFKGKLEELTQGTYTLALQFPKGATLVKLQVAEAKLQTLPEITLDPFHAFWPSDQKPFEFDFPFQETTGHAPITPAIQALASTGPDSTMVSPKLECAPLSLAAGGSGSTHCKVTGELPLGTSKSQLLVSSPRLTSPLSVTLKLRKRVAGVFIILVIFVGLAVGFLVRIAWSSLIQLRGLQADAWKQVGELDGLARLHPDQTLIAALGRIAEELQATSKSWKPKAVQEALDRAAAALKAALADLDARKAALVAEFDALRKVVEKPRKLTKLLEDTLVAIGKQLAEIKRALDADKLQGLNDQIDGQRKKLIGAINEAFAKLDHDFTAPLDNLKPPPELAEATGNDIKNVTAALGALTRDGHAEIDESLSQLSQLCWAVTDLVEHLSRRLGDLAAAIQKRLGPQAPHLVAQAAKILAPMQKQTHAESALAKAPEVLQSFNQEIAAKAPAQPKAFVQLDDEPSRAANRVAGALEAQFVGTPLAASRSPAASSRRYRQAALRARILQSLVLLLLVAFTGYFLVEERFDGTSVECASLFAWAFLIDLSTDAVSSLVRTLWKG